MAGLILGAAAALAWRRTRAIGPAGDAEGATALVEQTAWRTPVGDHPIRVSTEPGLIARVDRMRLAEVVANLVDNAAKFSPSGSPIDVRTARGHGGIEV